MLDTTKKCPFQKLNFDIFLMMQAKGKLKLLFFKFDIKTEFPEQFNAKWLAFWNLSRGYKAVCCNCYML